MTLPKIIVVRGEEPIDEPTYYARVHPQEVVRYAAECRRCGGAGYLRYHRPTNDPLFATLTACPNCRPVTEQETEPREEWWQK